METLIGIAELAYSRRVCSLNIFFDVLFKILYMLPEDETTIKTIPKGYVIFVEM